MKFKTRYSPGINKYQPTGAPEQVKHRKSFDKYGRPVLVEDGVRKIYEEIQSFEAETDIKNLVVRYAAGDLTALNKKPGFYADISGIPTNINDLNDLAGRVGQIYSDLPQDLRDKYDTVADLLKAVEDGSLFENFKNEEEVDLHPAPEGGENE